MIIFSCQKQEIIEDDIQETYDNNYVTRLITQGEIKTNQKLSEKLSAIKNHLSPKKNSKSAKNKNKVFNINLKEGTYVENKNTEYHSYTFSIENEEDNFNINNLVLSLDEDGNYLPYVMTYYLTEEERLLINNGLPVDLEGKQSIEPLSINKVNILSKGISADGCWEYEEVEVNCSCHCDEDHENAACGHPDTVTEANYIPRCGNNGGGGIGGGNNGPVTGPAGPSTLASGQPVVTTITTPTPKDDVNCSSVACQMNEILNDGDSFTFNSNINPNNDLKFNNVGEFKAFLQSAYSDIVLVEESYSQSQNTHWTNLKFNIPWTLTDFNVDINSSLETDTNDYKLEDVSSYLTGFSTLYGWTQTSSYSKIFNSNSDEVYIFIKGVHTFGIKIGESGLDYSKSVTIVVNINRKTGKLISYGWTN